MECSAQAFDIPYNGKREEHVWICGVILELKKAGDDGILIRQ